MTDFYSQPPSSRPSKCSRAVVVIATASVLLVPCSKRLLLMHTKNLNIKCESIKNFNKRSVERIAERTHFTLYWGCMHSVRVWGLRSCPELYPPYASILSLKSFLASFLVALENLFQSQSCQRNRVGGYVTTLWTASERPLHLFLACLHPCFSLRRQLINR